MFVVLLNYHFLYNRKKSHIRVSNFFYISTNIFNFSIKQGNIFKNYVRGENELYNFLIYKLKKIMIEVL